MRVDRLPTDPARTVAHQDARLCVRVAAAHLRKGNLAEIDAEALRALAVNTALPPRTRRRAAEILAHWSLACIEELGAG